MNEESTALEASGDEVQERRIRVQIEPHADMEARAVTGTVVNYVGDGFVITHIQGLPPAWRGNDEMPDAVQAKVVFRGIMSIPRWAEFVDIAADQLARLRRDGLVPDRQPENEGED